MPGTAPGSKRDGKGSTTSTCCGVRMELFSEAKALWAGQHNQIACQHDKDTVVLFRACCEHLGPHAATTGSFRGSPCYEKDSTRMMWFDTSFLVSMRKSLWGKKRGREIVLAVWVKRSFLEDCLGKAVCSNIFGSAAPSASSAAVAAAYGGGRPKPSRSLRARVGSASPATGGSEALDSAAATAVVASPVTASEQPNNLGSPISSSSSRTPSPAPFAAQDAFMLGSAALTGETVENDEGATAVDGGDGGVARRGAEAEDSLGNGRPLYRPATRKVYSPAIAAAAAAAAGGSPREHEGGSTVLAAAKSTQGAAALAALEAADSNDGDDGGDRQHRAFTESETMLSGDAYRSGSSVGADVGGGVGGKFHGSPPGPVDGSTGLFAQGGGGDDYGNGRARSKSMTMATADAAKVGGRTGLYGDGSGGSTNGRRMTNGVRLHWEPERLPSGEKVVQLGLKGTWLEALGSGDVVVKIRRLDDLLAQQRAVLESPEPHLLKVPVARPLDCGHLPDSQLEALHLVSERARPKLRILCLHGYLQNAQVFRQRTRQLSKKLRPMADLVYVDAPHLLSAAEMPPPRVPSLASPLATAAEAAAKAAAAAAAKVVITGEGGAPGVKDYDVSNNSEEGEDDNTSATSELPSSPETSRSSAATAATARTARQGIGSSSSSSVGSPMAGSMPANGGGGRPACVANDREGARTWWRCDAEERRIAKAVKGMSGRCEWKGLEESLSYLKQVWDEQGPFDGILGFSQGAAMASIFYHCVFGAGSEQGGQVNGACDGGSGMGVTASSSLGGKMPSSPPPRFSFFVSGCYQPHPTQIPSYPLPQGADQVELPSLHVWAVDDPFVPANQSQRLAGMYLRSSILMHQGSHCVPQNKETIQQVIRFLEEFR